MANETGLIQYFKWDEQSGSPVYNSAGLVVGGEVRAAYEDALRRGIGGQSAWSAGQMAFGCTPEVEVTADTKALIGYAIRASYPAGSLQELMLKAGTASVDLLYENAVINSLRLSGSPNDPLRAAFDIMALKETEAAVGDTEPSVGSLLDWYMGNVTIGGSGYDCEGFEATIDNQCRYRFDLDAKSANEKRLPSSIAIGLEQVSLTVRLREKLTWDVDADTPTRNIGAVIAYTDGVTTITLTFTNLAHTGARAMPFENEDGDIIWAYEFRGKPGSLVIT